MADALLIIVLRQFWYRGLFFGMQALPKNWGHMLMIKIGTTKGTGQTSRLNRSDRSGQLVQNAKWTLLLDSSRREDQDSYVERLIWSPDERDVASGRSAPRADRSDRLTGAVRPFLVCRIRVEVVF